MLWQALWACNTLSKENMDDLSLSFEYSLKYDNAELMQVKDVINSLRGLEGLSVRFLPETLTKLTGVGVERAEVYVEGFEHGSFVEKIVVRLFFKNEENMNEFLDKIRDGTVDIYSKIPGRSRPMLKAATITAAVAAIAIVGTSYAISTTDSVPPANIISLESSPIIIIGAEAYKSSPAEFLATVKGVVDTNKRQAAAHAARLVSPAKHGENGTLSFYSADSEASLEIDAETVKATPSRADLPPYEYTQDYLDVDLQIRATDRDSNDKGWAGVIPGVADRRVKLVLDEKIDPSGLAAMAIVRADVKVTFNKKQTPKLIEVMALIEDD